MDGRNVFSSLAEADVTNTIPYSHEEADTSLLRLVFTSDGVGVGVVSGVVRALMT